MVFKISAQRQKQLSGARTICQPRVKRQKIDTGIQGKSKENYFACDNLDQNEEKFLSPGAA